MVIWRPGPARHCQRLAMIGLLLTGVVGDLVAQGVVAGRVVLLERNGRVSHDLGNAIVQLEPLDVIRRERNDAPAFAEIDMRSREFVPRVQLVRVGGRVGFPNSDPFSHNVFSNSALGAFDLGLYRSRVTRTSAFNRPGVYAIYCNIHARMVSFVVAVATPFVARVGRDGRFTIAGVPAGSYRIRAWHERAPELTRIQDIPALGVSDVALTLDARGYEEKPHPNKFGAPYAATRADRY